MHKEMCVKLQAGVIPLVPVKATLLSLVILQLCVSMDDPVLPLLQQLHWLVILRRVVMFERGPNIKTVMRLNGEVLVGVRAFEYLGSLINKEENLEDEPCNWTGTFLFFSIWSGHNLLVNPCH